MTNDDPHAVTGDLARLRDWWAERRGDRERSIAWIHDLENEDEARNAVNRAIDSGATLIALHISNLNPSPIPFLPSPSPSLWVENGGYFSQTSFFWVKRGLLQPTPLPLGGKRGC